MAVQKNAESSSEKKISIQQLNS